MLNRLEDARTENATMGNDLQAKLLDADAYNGSKEGVMFRLLSLIGCLVCGLAWYAHAEPGPEWWSFLSALYLTFVIDGKWRRE